MLDVSSPRPSASRVLELCKIIRIGLYNTIYMTQLPPFGLDSDLSQSRSVSQARSVSWSAKPMLGDGRRTSMGLSRTDPGVPDTPSGPNPPQTRQRRMRPTTAEAIPLVRLCVEQEATLHPTTTLLLFSDVELADEAIDLFPCSALPAIALLGSIYASLQLPSYEASVVQW